MLKRMKPVGLSVAAAVLTAVAFAAVSMAAKDDGSSDEDGARAEGDVVFHARGPALSGEDQAKLEDFRKCMEDNGAPGPPAPPSAEDLENGDLPKPPEPPTEAERESVEKALEACEDKAPEGFGMHIGPGAPGGPCGPPPGVRADREGDQS